MSKKNKKLPKSVRRALKAGNILPASVIDKKHPKAVRKQLKAFVAGKAEKAAPRTGPYVYGEDPRFGGDTLSAIMKMMAEAAEVNQREAAHQRAEKALRSEQRNRYGDWLTPQRARELGLVDNLVHVGPGLYGGV